MTGAGALVDVDGTRRVGERHAGRWDAEETSRKLELLLGPELQFIRINGTVVGGLAGLGIHFVANVMT